MTVKLGEGMKALQAKVADRIIKYGLHKERCTTKLVRMRPEFKLAMFKAANRAGVSHEAYIRIAIAEKMKYEGDI